MASSSKGALHEEARHSTELQVGSDRSFGIVFTVFFGVLAYIAGKASLEPGFLERGLVGLVRLVGLTDFGPRNVYLAVAGVFLVLALVVPKVLHPLNVLWMRFGAVLQMVISPIILGLMFFVAITPMALVLRLLGKDLLRLKLDKSAKSYWLVRDPPGPAPESMRNQF